MSVHYKFKSALEYDTVTFDGLHISVKDLKNAIIQQKRIGKSTDFDLQVTNAQTKTVYTDENFLIPKNTSLLIARIPVIPQKTKQWEGYGGDNTPPSKVDEGGPIAKAVDLSSLDAPEDDKIKAMMSQSTQDYDPSNYLKIRGSNQVGNVPPNYKCYKCHQGGHWIKDCNFAQGPDPVEIRKSTGIPRSFMVAVEGPQVPGAMMTPNGQYAVPLVDHQAYNQKVVPTPVPEPKLDIPEDLVCSICSDLLTDAVMIPCCGNSFCDECIRGVLLESEDHECPDCHEKDILPDTLIPNRFLRKSVANFKNTTGYVKKQVYKEPDNTGNTKLSPVKGLTPPPREVAPITEVETEQKPVISEADSTESATTSKNSEFLKENENNDPPKSTESDSIEGPPGVSPRRSPPPKERHKRKDESPLDSRSSPREGKERSNRRQRSRDRSMSPRKIRRHPRSPSFRGSGSPERRSGTPTVDEPTSKYNPSTTYNSTIPMGSIPPIMGQAASIQAIPGVYQPIQPAMGGFPAAQGPPPNYRFPPPAGAPYMSPGPFNVASRPMFDASRPPLGGPPPNYNPNFPPRGHRDFGRRMIDRTPAGVIDDPLAAFNRLLREKDEQKRRAKQRSFRRSYSRSRSRSFSRSPVRRRSRSPRSNRRSRSRSRSFSLSRSRSRSFSGSLRGSPHRQLSPPRRSPQPSSISRRGPSRYRSPLRSPPRSRRDRDYDDDRDYNRDERTFKDNRRTRDNRERRSRDRDRDRYFDNFDDKRGPPRQQQWGQQTMPPRPMQEGYYPPPAMQQGYQTNRFGQGPPHRDFGPPFMNKEPPYAQTLPQTIHTIQRQYQDIAPPGVDDDIAPPGVEEPPFKPEKKESPKKEEKEKVSSEKRSDKKESDKYNDRKRRHEKRSRTPERARNPSPKRKSKSRERDTPEKHRRRRRDSSDKEDKRRDHSDDERSKKNKDKKKHRDKKESDKKKKRDKKDKHKKEGKEKKKDEFKQIIPKNIDEVEEIENQKILNKKKREEIEERELEEKRLNALKEEKRLEALKEEQRSEALKEEKRKNQENKAMEGETAKQEKREKVRVKEIEESKRRIALEERKEYTPEPEELKPDLYGEIPTEDIDTSVMENYGKLDNELIYEGDEEFSQRTRDEPEETMEEGEIKELDDEEKDVLELHTTDMDLKTEIDKSDILAPVPEKSKWENDDEGLTSPKDSNKSDSKSDKSGKVTNEVLKRAENAIFAKAINAIRPIEIKKIGPDRAKLYSGEREVEKSFNQFQVTIGATVVKPDPVQQAPVRLSVKERLGVKVEDTDKVINLSRRSRTVSPFSRRGENGRNFAAGERRVEVDEFRNRRRSRSRRRESSRDIRRNRTEVSHHSRHDRRNDRRREKTKKEEKSKHDEDNKKSKRKRSRSRSESDDRKDRHKKKDKKTKKEKLKKKEEGDLKTEKDEKDEPKPEITTKRKATIDEAAFEPDYDESHSEEEERDKKKGSKKETTESSSSESESESSSEEERKKKKHKKHKKRKKRDTSSSSSSSSSESDSSESEKERKKRKHKKSKKKKKKSKHK
nr:E3 ubiquitin-protein ligase RBBP6 isoform X1 [Leptinotarsa decemlineata]